MAALKDNTITQLKKAIVTVVLCLYAVVVLCNYAYAQTTISGVSIYIDSSIAAGTSSTDVSAYTTSDRYEVESVTVNNVPSSSDGWSDSAKPKLTIVLKITDTSGYKFGSVKKDAVSIYGDPGDSNDASVTGVSKSSDGTTLTIKYTMAALDSVEDDEEYNLYTHDTSWEELSGTANWEGGDDAKYFKVILYNGSDTAASITTSDSSFCFARYFTKAGSYKFTVQAYKSSSRKGNVASSSTLKVSQQEAKDIYDNYKDETGKSTNVKDLSTSNSTNVTSSAAGGPNTTNNGSWVQDSKGWWYREANGSYPVSNWKYINNKWYYFGADGYMVTGWRNIDNAWYYFDTTNGDMWVSRNTPDGYQLDVSGKMVVSATIVQDMTVNSGVWQQDSTGWWYRYDNGTYVQDAWKEINGEWYYFGSNGYMLTGWQKIGGVYYYLDPTTGAMWHDRYTTDGYHVDSSGVSNRTDFVVAVSF